MISPTLPKVTSPYLSFLLLLVCTSIPVCVQSQYFPSRQYTTTDGMPSPGVYDITQTSDGMMWFMTKVGPTYYNTKEWVTFPDSLDLPSSHNSKIVASGNTIWVAGLNDTTFSLNYFDGAWHEVSSSIRSNDLLYHLSFNVYNNGESTRLLLGVRGRLMVYDTDNEKWSAIPLNGKGIRDIKVLDGACYITTSQGLFIVQGDTITSVNLPYDQFPDMDILTLTKRNNTLYILGSDWYAEVVEDTVDLLIEGVGISEFSREYQSTLIVNEDIILYGANTPTRMIDRENKSWRNLPIDGGLSSTGSTRLFKDKENTIWISDSRGLYKLNTLRFTNYNKNSGLAENEVSAMQELSNGLMLIANPRKLNVKNGSTFESFSLSSETNLGFRVLDIEEDPKRKEVYLATNNGGLLIYRNNQFSKPIKVIKPDGTIFTSVELHNGRTYVAGTYGFYELVNQKLQLIDSIRGIRNLVSTAGSLALLSNSKGAYLYNGDSYNFFASKNFDLNSVYDVVIYEGSTLLATREGTGIAKDGVITLDPRYTDKFPTYSLLVDHKGRLWSGTDRGAFMYDGDQRNFYGIDEGLAGREVNRNAFFEDSNGNIWIGTESGASVFKGGVTSRNLNLDIDITGITSGKGELLSESKESVLPYDDNDLRVIFQCLSYVNEDQLSFRYRIDQLENAWVVLTSAENDVTFNNLEYGDYTFEIQARYGREAWGPVTDFEFTILKPYYLKWWFIVLGVIVLFLVTRTIFFFRYVYLIKQKNKLKLLVHYRTKEILLLNENLEEKVKLRTKELEEKNKKLQEYAYINAHYLRGPLSKVMSVLHILKLDKENHINKKYIEILQEAVDELDEVIHSITDHLED